MALEQAGRLSLADLLRPAADIAAAGYPIDRVMARNLRDNIESIRRFPAASRILLRENSRPHQEGELLVQTGSCAKPTVPSRTDGIEWFYEDLSRKPSNVGWRKTAGLITAADFSAYRPRQREPIVTSYRGYTIVGFPPPSSGGVHVAQILNILECFDLRSLHERDPALFMHVVAEAMKLAFADRAHWLGDSDFAKVPKGLIDKRYAQRLAQRISLDHVSDVEGYGLPDDWQTNAFGKHTTHIAAADRRRLLGGH